MVAGAGTRTLELAHGLLGLGLLGGLAAAPFGWLDWRRIPLGTRARWVGAWHGGGNALALVLFALSWSMREPGHSAPAIALGLSLAAGACMLCTAWLGGELVTRLGVGVYVGANLDAPSSLLSTKTLLPPTQDHSAVDLLTSVAGEEDPGAAVDPPGPPRPSGHSASGS